MAFQYFDSNKTLQNALTLKWKSDRELIGMFDIANCFGNAGAYAVPLAVEIFKLSIMAKP